jgi:uncharacterized protein (TIGR03435 family)
MAKSTAILTGLLVTFLPQAAPQSPAFPSFEVASVKQNDTPDPGRQGALFRDQVDTSTGRVVLRNVTLKTCIKWAYALQDPQIGGSGWLSTQRYDIQAKSIGPSSEDQLRLMLRTLLAERFKLVAHTETRAMSAAVLTVGRKPPKLTQSDDEGPGSLRSAGGRIVAERITMAELAAALADPLRMPVVDSTGLPHRYNFTLDFTAFTPQDGQTPDEMTTTIAVVRQQLGLDLDSRKVPVEFLVVDSANRIPTEN